jgi:hypothetical protein
MKIIFVILLSVFGHQASAQALPPCWPKQIGSTGSSFKRGADGNGHWLGWTCTTKGVTTTYGVFALNTYSIKHPVIEGMTASKAAQAYWKANVTASSDPKLIALRAKMEASFQ